MIRKELKERGYTRSLDEIKRSLAIMAGTILEVEMEGRGRGIVYSNTILSDMVRTTRADIADDPNAKCMARLPALISKGINGLDYRQYRVYPNKGTRSPTGLCLISDAHDCLPAGLELSCDC